MSVLDLVSLVLSVTPGAKQQVELNLVHSIQVNSN